MMTISTTNKATTTAAITQPLGSIERSRKTYDLTGREKLLKKLDAEEIIQTLRSNDSLKNVTEMMFSIPNLSMLQRMSGTVEVLLGPGQVD